jgi:para-nitrobenzyl esterase
MQDSMVSANPMEAARKFAPKPRLIGWTREETGSFFAGNPAMKGPPVDAVLSKFKEVLGPQGAVRCERDPAKRVHGTPYSAMHRSRDSSLFRSLCRLAERLSSSFVNHNRATLHHKRRMF